MKEEARSLRPLDVCEQAVESRREPTIPVLGQAPLPHETSLTEHKFEHKTKDFKTAKPEH